MKPLGDFEGASGSFTTIGEGRVLVVDPDAQSFGFIEGTSTGTIELSSYCWFLSIFPTFKN